MHFLLLIALLEVAINRIAVPMLRPAKGVPPGWHEQLDYLGLFLFYFTGTLALFALVAHVVRSLRERRGIVDGFAQVALSLAGVLAAVPLLVAVPPWASLALEIAFAVAVLALVTSGLGHDRDLGVQLGLVTVAIPLVVHTVAVLGAEFLWPETTFDGEGVMVARAGVLSLCLAAITSPYVFAPRPFARSVTKIGPLLFAISLAGIGATAARAWYPKLAKAATLAIGVEVNQSQTDPRMAVYLLAVSTLAWTLASLAIAKAQARRQIGVGLGLLLLGGYGFHWPHHYLLPLVGLALIADASRRVREEEVSAMPISTETPPISDASWGSYISNVTAALKRTLTSVHSLTTRGDGGLVSTQIVGEKAGMQVRVRVERIEGSVIALDVVLGREIDEVRGATLCLWAIPPKALGVNPAGPPAAPLFRTGDAGFDLRFKTRGSALAFNKLFDEALRGRAVASLDGWLAYWEPDGMRYRVYPGRGAPLDHPMPLSDLALNRSATPDRLVIVIELLVGIAERGIKVTAFDDPTNLDVAALKDDATDAEAKPIEGATDAEAKPIEGATDVEGRALSDDAPKSDDRTDVEGQAVKE